MATKFYLRTTKEGISKETRLPIQVEVRKGSDFRFRGALNMTVPSSWFGKDGIKANLLLNVSDGEYYQKVCDTMKELMTRFGNEVLNNPENMTNEYCKSILDDVLRPEEDIKETDVIPTDIYEYVCYLVNEICTGKRSVSRGHNSGMDYPKNSQKTWRSCRELVKRFLDFYNKSHKKLTWGDIDTTTATAFRQWMEKEGYAVASVDKHLKNMRTIINYAWEMGVNTNQKSLKAFKSIKIDEDDVSAKIVLTKEELDALLDMKLDGMKKTCRDLFCIGTAICQRVSDYSTITKDMFSYSKNGVLLLRIEQQKTSKVVIVPIVNEKVINIIKSYDYQLPHVWQQVINRNIKDICMELSQTMPSLKESVATHLTMKERDAELPRCMKKEHKTWGTDEEGNRTKYRYECVTTHTARRTGLTLLYNTGLLSMEELRTISGHSTIQQLKHYLMISEDDKQKQAEDIANRICGKF